MQPMRVSEKWFHRALWLISFAFAGFLIGLGGLVVGNLPGVEAPPTLESLIDPTASAAIQTSLQQAQSSVRDGELAQLSLFAVPALAMSLIFKDVDLKGLHYRA